MLAELWNLLTSSLRLESSVFSYIQTEKGLHQAWVLFALAVLSKSLGEAGILYINRATKGQYVRGLLGSLAVLGFAAVVWSACIWSSCHIFLGLETTYRSVFTIVLISYAPLIFSCFDIVPHLGLLCFKILTIWGLMITVAGLHLQLGITVLQALASSALGWVLFYLLNSAFGGAAERIRLRLLGRDSWVNPKEAAVALLEREIYRS